MTIDSGTTTSYRAKATLPLRVEFVRQLRRRRTLVAYLLVVALPVMVSLAVKFGSNANSGRRLGGGTPDLVGLATSGAANFTVTMFFFAAGFLLLVIVALFCGDTVASEASWSSLRYLLAAPVPRRRLLKQKLIVGLALSLGAIATLPLASFAIGLVAFGSGPLQSPLGASYSLGEALWRIAAIGAFIFVSLLFAAGVAFLMSVLTDAPLGAVGAAVVLVIISNILNAIEALGSLREWLPTHYSQAWLDLLAPDVDWTNMARGASYSIVACAVCVAYAVYRFDRKDVVS
ncbi:MAG: ABC transporter permease subunit [Actinobacteria bacterium]|jgi:ABC-2 type transport system permease protein|nr:ABC transporter permease subunit [Actinomycetota bacterium]